jgi:hypothetical protein
VSTFGRIEAGGILHGKAVSDVFLLGPCTGTLQESKYLQHNFCACFTALSRVGGTQSDVILVRHPILHRYSCWCGAADAGMGAEMHPSMNSTLHCHEDAASLTRLITSAGFTVLGIMSTST